MNDTIHLEKKPSFCFFNLYLMCSHCDICHHLVLQNQAKLLRTKFITWPYFFIYTFNNLSHSLHTSRVKSLCCPFLIFSISRRNLLSFTGKPPSSLITDPGSAPTSSQNTRPNKSSDRRQRPSRASWEIIWLRVVVCLQQIEGVLSTLKSPKIGTH